MVKFKFVSAVEDRVITVNAAKSITLNGQVIPIGSHLVTFSGRATLSSADETTLKNTADNNADEILITNEGEIVGGPLWEKVTQCSPILAGSSYLNTNSDEDDWQGWSVNNGAWDTVDENGKKRIRLNFNIGQHGEKTLFWAVNYKVTATGDLAFASETAPTPPTPPTPPIPPIPTPSECDKLIPIIEAKSTVNLNPNLPEANVIDGKLDTKWMSTVTQNPWIRLSLQEQKPICKVDIAWTDATASRVYKFYIEVSTDMQDWGTPVFTGLSTGNTNDYESYTCIGNQANFVRVTVTDSGLGTGNSQAQISEIRVFSTV